VDSDLISIIVPVYNVEQYLDKCMESIVHQTYKNIEIILIDDGSTDNSSEKCDDWAEKDNRIIVIHKENGGVSSARNRGLKEAKGRYIGFVDPDDYIDKDMYRKMYEEIQKDNIDFVFCDFNVISFDKKKKDSEINKCSVEIMDKYQAFLECFPFNGYVWKGLFITERLKNICFDTKIYIAEDLVFIIEYISKCEKDIIYIREKLYNYVTRKDSAVFQKSNFKSKALKRQIDMLSTLKYTEKIIVENCKEKEIIQKIESKMVSYYWIIIYPMINERLLTNNELLKKYYNELKEYRQYFSKKDKVYMILLGINSNLFGIVYGTVKRLKNFRE